MNLEAFLSSVHAGKTALETDSETVCASPICSVRFNPAGSLISPKLYCSNNCRQHASLLRRAAKLLEPLPDQEAIEILRRMR